MKSAFYEPSSAQAWNVATFDAVSFIKTGIYPKTSSTGKEIKSTDLKYTIIDDETVVFRDLHELAELYKATDSKLDIMSLVSFRPERLVLHYVIALAIARVQLTPLNQEESKSLEHDKMLQRVIQYIHQDIKAKQNYIDIIKTLYNKRIDISYVIAKLLLGETIPNLPGIDQSLISSCEEALKHCRSAITNKELGEHVNQYTANTALIALATDMVYNKYANEITKIFVDAHIDFMAAHHQISLFECPPAHERELFFVAGGSASGKGAAYAQLRYLGEKSNVLWINISKGGRDNYSKLLEPKNLLTELSDQLTANEASYIYWTLTRNILIEMAKNSRAPHILSENPPLREEMLELALINNGGVKVIMVSTKVEDAIERSYYRGLETGRYVPTKKILANHKNSTMKLPQTLAKYPGKKIEILFLDNNVPKGSKLEQIAFINCFTKEIIICNEEKFKEFIKKTAINESATKLEELYDKDKIDAITTDSYFAPCIAQGYTVSINSQLKATMSPNL